MGQYIDAPRRGCDDGIAAKYTFSDQDIEEVPTREEFLSTDIDVCKVLCTLSTKYIEPSGTVSRISGPGRRKHTHRLKDQKGQLLYCKLIRH
jgi:hypothetical protein